MALWLATSAVLSPDSPSCEPNEPVPTAAADPMSGETPAEMAIFKSSAFAAQKVALLACGCFNPPTYMHLRMFGKCRRFQRTLMLRKE